MKIRPFVKACTLLLVISLYQLPAKASFEFNANCLKAYENILCFRLGSARSLIAAEKKLNPENSIPYLLDNYVDYFTIITSESKSDFERLKNNKSYRINRISRDDKNSPYNLFAQAEINLQWALIRGRFQEYITSSVEINKAYNQLQENSKRFPAFLPNQKDLGMINALLGSLPQGLRRTMSVFGIQGNTQAGVRMLEKLVSLLPASPYAHYYDETVFYLAYVQTDILGDKNSYSSIIRNTQQMDPASLLRTYIRGYSGMKMAHNNDAIQALSSRPLGNLYQPYPYLDYLLGTAKMHRLDPSAATHFQAYLRAYHGINFIKDAYLQLAWLAQVKGDTALCHIYLNQVKTRGLDLHERDKQALNEAGDALPDPGLLKARLLFDGGYYDRALDEIDNRKAESFKTLRDKIEFAYRLGRIYDETGRDDLALKFYQIAVTTGRSERYYFASNAALRAGNIYEKRKNLTQARVFYNAVIAMKDHDYESSIENKARDALKRIGG